MSIAEAERFSKDLTTNKALLNEVVSKAAGVASIVQIANAHGYSVTVDEAKQYLESRSPKELSDAQLDAVAGGKGHPSTTSTTAVQTSTVATTVSAAAEVADVALVAGTVIAVAAAVFT